MTETETDQLALFGVLGDTPARDAIGRELDATLFVEAGAGTGKTKALVDRVVALVTSDGPDLPVPVSAIAAITFTEKAAAELRDRIRSELRELADDEFATTVVRARCRVALDDLDLAAICTLHSFAQRILTEFPIEIGLPPRIEVRDEISSRIAFDARWREFVDEMLDDPELESTMLVLLAAGVKLPHLRTVAEKLDDNWDLLDRVGAPVSLPTLDIKGWLSEFDAACAVGHRCRAADDRLLGRLGEFAAYRERLRGAFDDAGRIEVLLAAKPSFNVARTGNQKNWDDIEEVRGPLVKLGEQRKAMTDAFINGAIRRVVAAIAVYIDRSVAARRTSGELDFHDLLVLARALLRHPEHGVGARARLWERYQRILIDEFQDTDPIQVELAALLGSDDPADGDQPWNEMSVEPGRLFFVGDPKQSIYRFRRADIATFLEARDRFAQGAPRFLTCNFRTAPRVLGWINHVFSELIQPYTGSQPEYRPLDPARPVPAEHDRGVVLLGVEPHVDDGTGLKAGDLRAREAADVAAIARAAVAEEWPVYDKDRDEWRAARLGDVCILLPARTSLGYLEQALGAAGVPYRAETSSLVYSSREVRDLLMTLRALDDSSNTLALVAALRSSVFGCGDDDLFHFHVELGGRWDIVASLPEELPEDDPVGVAMRFLGALHSERVWSTPSELLERIVRERAVIEVGALSGRFRDVARRVRFLIDQARAYADAVGGTLRDYLAWAEMQGAEGARVVEAVVPETDDDAVRLMTIHGAKGLEFPIVVCSGMTTAAQAPSRGVELLFPPAGGYEAKIVKGVQTADYELYKPIDEQMGFHEKLRLLYVACTRARDHLVVSVHRRAEPTNSGDPTRWTHAELLWNAARNAQWTAPDPDPRAPAAGRVGPAADPPEPGLAPEVWQEEYDRAHRRGNRRGFVSATTLAHRLDTVAVGAGVVDDPGLAKEGRDLELPPWNKGRYGTAIGRAVHATLQTIDLTTGAGIEPAAAAQAAAEGVLGYESTIAALTRAALASAVVTRAAARPHWREMYVAVPFEGITLEGYVDLVFRDDDGLVVVDYKTDAVDAQTRADRIAHYRIQAAAYALAVTEATGEPVVRGVLCFLDPAGAMEVEFAGSDLEGAVEEVRALLVAEREDPSRPPPLVPADA